MPDRWRNPRAAVRQRPTNCQVTSPKSPFGCAGALWVPPGGPPMPISEDLVQEAGGGAWTQFSSLTLGWESGRQAIDSRNDAGGWTAGIEPSGQPGQRRPSLVSSSSPSAGRFTSPNVTHTGADAKEHMPRIGGVPMLMRAVGGPKDLWAKQFRLLGPHPHSDRIDGVDNATSGVMSDQESECLNKYFNVQLLQYSQVRKRSHNF